MDRRFLKPGWLVGHLIMVAAVVVCVRLGLWQWHRSNETSGTLQNLAYAVLWPAFGLGFIYMWVRFLFLEKSKDEQDDRELDDGIAAILEQGQTAADGDRPATAGAAPASAGAAPASETGDHNAPARTTGSAGHPEPATFVGYVPEVDDEDDPELAAYNRALAALAEKDRRAR